MKASEVIRTLLEDQGLIQHFFVFKIKITLKRLYWMFKLKSMKIGKLYKMTATLGYDIPLITENGSEVSIVVYG